MACYGLGYGLPCNSRLAGWTGGADTPISIYCASLGGEVSRWLPLSAGRPILGGELST